MSHRSVLSNQKRQADEDLVLQHVEELVNTLSLSHSQFHDETFPATCQSLFIDGNSLSESTKALLPAQQPLLSPVDRRIQWLRPAQIHPARWTGNETFSWAVFRDPKANDVLQGALGKHVMPLHPFPSMSCSLF